MLVVSLLQQARKEGPSEVCQPSYNKDKQGYAYWLLLVAHHSYWGTCKAALSPFEVLAHIVNANKRISPLLFAQKNISQTC